jgi:alkylation response protein AidB-like acyl-CoA dehydrogenase
MDFSWSREEEAFRQDIRAFLKAELPQGWNDTLVLDKESEEYIALAKGFTQKVGAKGWLAAHWPQEYGGLGWSFWQYFIMNEEMAIADAPLIGLNGPKFLGPTIIHYSTEAQRQRHLPGIAKGTTLWVQGYSTAPSVSFAPSGISVRAAARNGGFVIDGTKLFVTNAQTADTLLVAVRTGDTGGPDSGISLLLVPGKAPGIDKTPLQTIAADRQFEVEFRHVEVGAGALLGELHQGWPLLKKTLDHATVAKCSEMVGMAQVAFDMAVDYAKNRVQFGRPIGSFQAIKHKCADMVIDVDGSRFITYRAAWCLAHGIEASKEIAMAKAWTSDACRRVCAATHQIHGGIGFTKEYDLQLYFRRAKQGEVMYGDADLHREVVAQAIGL